jgi:hypothetical protein
VVNEPFTSAEPYTVGSGSGSGSSLHEFNVKAKNNATIKGNRIDPDFFLFIEIFIFRQDFA